MSPRLPRVCALLWLGILLLPLASAADDPFAAERRKMVDEIAAMAAYTGDETGREKFDPRVLEVMGRVPRHRFVPPEQVPFAYKNRPLPIGHGQTISQPYIVALMTDLMNLKPGDRALEIGTGSGYQAAVLAAFGAEVSTIEIIEPLGRRAQAALAEVGYGDVNVRIGDGYYGWEEHAPFDSIIVTAAASHVPPPLVKQLKPGGRMVIPVGGQFLTQHLLLIEKAADGSVTSKQILPVRFVPLTGGH